MFTYVFKESIPSQPLHFLHEYVSRATSCVCQVDVASRFHQTRNNFSFGNPCKNISHKNSNCGTLLFFKFPNSIIRLQEIHYSNGESAAQKCGHQCQKIWCWLLISQTSVLFGILFFQGYQGSHCCLTCSFVDPNIAEEIRWALEGMGFWYTGEIKITKEPFGHQRAIGRHCSVFLSVDDDQMARDYVQALHGNIVTGISAPGETRGCMVIFVAINGQGAIFLKLWYFALWVYIAIYIYI